MQFQLLGEETKVEINVFSREYPNSSDYWDGNWLIANVKIDIPGYSVDFDGSVRTDEIQDFYSGLKAMEQNLLGKATLKTIEDFIHFECEINKLGHIHWSGETCYPIGSRAILQFEFVSDQTYLQRLLQELKQMLDEYPVVGHP
ncbi:hypothetical protein [Alkalihalobacillus sp. LMS39]|uniref:WapI family immunity protein n=1 Tax=Alkalihalobacillus sp. LMS39 TaxID=2924032 RepID=UPI001FB34368|nr:hypothetical protein [Alkalihalobacillus sp. LMS39]UOE95406.1 hypothetical protein MM271_07265 [Alkalihalobacillus sp. LMS39]